MPVHLVLRNSWRSMLSDLGEQNLAAVIGERVTETDMHQPLFTTSNVNDPVLADIPDRILFTASYQDVRVSHFLPEGNFSLGVGVSVRVENQRDPKKSPRQIVSARGEGNSTVREAFFAVWEGRLDPEKEHTDQLKNLPRLSLKQRIAPYERMILRDELYRQGGSRDRTADALGISRTTLFNKMHKYRLLGVNFDAPRRAS